MEYRELAVIGNGCAGLACIRALRACGDKRPILVLSDTHWPAYNPMLTTYFAGGKISREQMFLFGRNEDLRTKLDAEIWEGFRAADLDAEGRVIRDQTGRTVSYGQCLVATGASPILPRTPGMTRQTVFFMRTMDDALRLRRRLEEQPPRSAAVIGASMVGVKVMELLHARGCRVTLADLAPHILPGAASPECAREMERRLESGGIRLCLGVTVDRLEPDGTLVLSSGERLESDLTVVCIGVRSNLDFLRPGQVETDRGLLVDEYMRTSAPGLYAAGDAAQGRELLSGESMVIGLLANARRQGRTAGRNLAGVKTPYPGNVLHNITHFMDMEFLGAGSVRSYDQVRCMSRGDSFAQLFWTKGRLTGVNLLNGGAVAGPARQALFRQALRAGGQPPEIPDEQNLLLRDLEKELVQPWT